MQQSHYEKYQKGIINTPLQQDAEIILNAQKMILFS